MREGDDLFFAPGVRFAEVALSGPELVDQLRRRIDGFYLTPARLCIDHGHAFAAGLLIVSTIDFLAGLHHSAQALKTRNVGADFCTFVRSKLPSFASRDVAQRLYNEFRNGLTHEARIKNAGEFSFDWDQTVRLVRGRLCINPTFLLKEIEVALERRLQKLIRSEEERRAVAERLRDLFSKEFGIVERARTAV